MGHPTLLPTHKVPIDNFNTLASQLRQAGAKFRSSVRKQDATIVFSQLPDKALSILESGANFQDTCEADLNLEPPTDLSGSTLTQVSSITQETSEFASNMELAERQEVSHYKAEQVLAKTQLTEVDNTTESVEISGEILMDELVEITPRESVEIAEPSEQHSRDNLIEATAPEIVESVEDAPEFVESVENAVELVESTTLATEEQLLSLSKTKLKKLANKYGIEGRTKLEHHELAAALANKVPFDNL
ncbi:MULTISPECIES: hypothetical protein [Aerosakkonema]|uniref:hypothetical protein n=1 Tax=Aerosakkonema TaxID=1246629 RepID=UPI0035B9E650